MSICITSSPRRRDTRFYFIDTPTTTVYTLSLHDALPIFDGALVAERPVDPERAGRRRAADRSRRRVVQDRKSILLEPSVRLQSYQILFVEKQTRIHQHQIRRRPHRRTLIHQPPRQFPVVV